MTIRRDIVTDHLTCINAPCVTRNVWSFVYSTLLLLLALDVQINHIEFLSSIFQHKIGIALDKSMDDTGFVSGSALYRGQEDSEQDQASQVPVASSSKQQAKIGAYFGQVEAKRLELKKRKYPPLKPSDCRRYVIESL